VATIFGGQEKKSILIFVKLFSQKIIFKGFFGDIFSKTFQPLIWGGVKSDF